MKKTRSRKSRDTVPLKGKSHAMDVFLFISKSTFYTCGINFSHVIVFLANFIEATKKFTLKMI